VDLITSYIVYNSVANKYVYGGMLAKWNVIHT
jgi:hypothetical protein